MGEGMTPVIRSDDNVLLRMDYFMSTLSFKDRGAAVLVAHCKSIGVEKVVQDSSGNAGNSVAAYCARAGIACEIFVPEGTSSKKINMIEAHGAIANVLCPAVATTAPMSAAPKSKQKASITPTTSITPSFTKAPKPTSMKSMNNWGAFRSA
ncbi:hypothetical protein HMPREF9080_02678 [Cardiobacterium valvarum F0432]|uniref:Tryptophan synthase beta chain-like PALP domain-containing protein n=1 Tax=Cardiobacterium valvarum F0432 TaxID=797473 RepID=G9ZIR5_9GAMM|nr:hypothetical protein HMPREF9080_02678 [Cardiobacterium valvarum F0432]